MSECSVRRACFTVTIAEHGQRRRSERHRRAPPYPLAKSATRSMTAMPMGHRSQCQRVIDHLRSDTLLPTQTMMPHRRMTRQCWFVLVIASSLGAATAAVSQDTVHILQLAERGPRFLTVPEDGSPPTDARDAQVLRRKVTLEVDRAPLSDVLDVITRQTGIRFVFSDEVSVARGIVSLHADNVSVAGALFELLLDARLDVRVAAGETIVLTPRDAQVVSPSSSRRASTGTVRGIVRDAETGERLASVLVSVQGTSLHDYSAGDGQYAIEGVPSGTQTLVARRLGYAPTRRTFAVAEDQVDTINFSLAKSSAFLDQVVTTATGKALAQEVGNAMSAIQADSVVAHTGVAALGDVIDARIPGVQVFNAGGLVGVSPQVNIRGQNSATLSNQPLLYVDGVRVANSVGNTAESTDMGRFNDIAPDEIESIEVIKGPAASALYGTDAANGIVLIHTKRGIAGRPRWTMYGETGSSSVNKSLYPDNYTAYGHLVGGPGGAVPCPLSGVAERSCVQDSILHFSPLKDPATTPLSTGGLNELGAQVAGGNDIRYFLSGTYVDQGGYLQLPTADKNALAVEEGAAGISPTDMHPNGLIKQSGRGTLTAPLGPTADATVTADYLTQTDRLPFASEAIAAAFGGAAFRDSSDGWALDGRPLFGFVQNHREEVNRYTFGFSPTWRPFRWLSAQGTAGLDGTNLYKDTYTQPGIVPYEPGGIRANARNDALTYTAMATAAASVPVSSMLSSTSTLGVNYVRTINHFVTAAQAGLSPGCTMLGCGAVSIGNESNTDAITAGAFGEQTFGLNDRLFLKAGLRVDGGSSFGSNYQTALYPRASLSWSASNEPFFPRIPGLSLLRLRAAYGQAGVQPDATSRFNVESTAPVFVGGVTTLGASLTQLGNNNLRPERQEELEGGADAEWFGGRVHLEGTYYVKKSSDALVNEALPTSVGAFTEQVNIGSVLNLGYEALLTVRALDNRLLSWDVSMNGSVNHNKLLKFTPGLTCASASPDAQSCVGYPLYSFFDFPVTYADRNHDGIIDTNEVTIGTTARFLGQSYPKTQLTLATTMAFFRGHVQLNATADYRGGFVLQEGELLNQGTQVQALWVPGSSLHDQAAAIAAQQGATSGYLVNGEFTRLRNVSLTIALPDKLVRTLRGRSASITLSGLNLLLWTKYHGGDPEQAGGPQSLGAFLTGPGLGVPRTFAGRVTLGL
jgi:TonB-linked SusC/RagA family outer membrane protein